MIGVLIIAFISGFIAICCVEILSQEQHKPKGTTIPHKPTGGRVPLYYRKKIRRSYRR